MAIGAATATVSIGGTTLSEVRVVSGMGASREMHSTYHLSSSGQYETYLPGKKTTKPITVEFHLDMSNPSQADAIEDFDNTTASAIVVTFSDGETFSGNAFVSDYEASIPDDGPVEGSLTLTPTGDWAWSTIGS